MFRHISSIVKFNSIRKYCDSSKIKTFHYETDCKEIYVPLLECIIKNPNTKIVTCSKSYGPDNVIIKDNKPVIVPMKEVLMTEDEIEISVIANYVKMTIIKD